MGHCSFCRRASRVVVHEDHDVAMCNACAQRIAKLVNRLADDTLGGLWDLASGKQGPAVDADERRDVLDDFRRGVAERVSPDDALTHFDLGMAYAEMGLCDEAVHEYEVAREFIGPERLYDVDVCRARALDDAGRRMEGVRLAAQIIDMVQRADPVVVEVLLRRLPAGNLQLVRDLLFVQ